MKGQVSVVCCFLNCASKNCLPFEVFDPLFVYSMKKLRHKKGEQVGSLFGNCKVISVGWRG